MTNIHPNRNIVIIILLLVIASYLNSLGNSFVFDDHNMVVENGYIKDINKLPKVFGPALSSVMMKRGMYRPFLMLSFAFNYAFGGLNPAGYHIINILIHFLNAILLYLLLGIFLPNLRHSLKLALVSVFCVHPVNTEAVVYISSRSTIMSAFFILTSLYNYILWNKEKRSFRYCLLSLFLYLSALLTKESALVLPLLILAYELIFNRENPLDIKEIFKRLLPFFLLTAVYFLALKLIFSNTIGMFAPDKLVYPRSIPANILAQSQVAFLYLYLFIFPLYLNIDQPLPFINSAGNPQGIISLALIVLLLVLGLRYRKQFGLLSFSCLWYFVALLPKFYARLNLIAAEHHAYLAFFAVYFAIGYCLSRYKVKSNIYLKYIYAFILILFLLLTIIRNIQWKSALTLWQSSVKLNPNSSIALANLGIEMWKKRFWDKGRECFINAAKQNNQTASIFSFYNLAYYYALKGEPQKGVEILLKNKEICLKGYPEFYYRILALIYMRMGKESQDEAIMILEGLISKYPDDGYTKALLGELYLSRPGERQKAKEYFQAAAKDDPDLYRAHFGLGIVLEDEDSKEAVKEYKKAIRIEPQTANGYYRLGLLYARKLLDPQAEWYFKKAIELDPNFAPAYYDLCILYLYLPKPNYARAEEYFNRAKKLGFPVNKDFALILEESKKAD